MVRFYSKLFIFFIIFIFSSNLYAVDFMVQARKDAPAADFTLQDLSGNQVSLDNFQGKPAILFFWTTWCPHCRWQIQKLNKDYEAIKSAGMVLLSIDIGEPRSVVEDFIDRHAIKYPVLLDDEAKAASAYQVTGVPTFILISKDAEIISVTNDLPSNYKELLTR